MPHLERYGDVFVLFLGDEGERDGQNALHPDLVDGVNRLLDEVEAHDGPAALVTTAIGKYYSTGLDTAWIAENVDQINPYVTRVQELFARILTFPMATVAAVPGHVYGGGAILAVAHDHVVMRADRGFFCLPGVRIGASYAPGSLKLLAARLPARAGHAALTSGDRYGGADACALGLIDETAPESDVLARAVERARGLIGTRGRTLGEIKHALYPDVVAELRTPLTTMHQHEAFTGS